MTRIRPLFVVFAVALSVMSHAEMARGGDLDLDQQFERFLNWFPGEYNNHEQVWQARIDGVEPHEHLHHIFAPVNIPALGEHVFFIQQHMNADPDNIYRLRLYTLRADQERQAIELKIYSFIDEDGRANAHLEPDSLLEVHRDELRTIPGCEVFWTWNGSYFDGHMDEGACTFVSPRSGQRITITDDLRLTENEIWIRDVARDEQGNLVFGDPDRDHHKNRKVQYYDAWIAIKREGRAAAADNRDWIGMRDLRMHNEHQIVEVVDDQQQAMGYQVVLSRLTYQAGGIPVLRLAVIEEATGRTLAYAWGAPGAERIGINIGWLQAGLTLVEGRERFAHH